MYMYVILSIHDSNMIPTGLSKLTSSYASEVGCELRSVLEPLGWDQLAWLERAMRGRPQGARVCAVETQMFYIIEIGE